MGNTPWMDRWKRSPRQDRRVVENGRFVELGQVHVPEPPPEVPEQEQSALEIVQEPANVPERERISGTFFEEGRYEPVDTGASAAGNVPSDAPNGSSEVGHGSSEQSNEADRSTETGIVQPISDSSVSTPEGQSVSKDMTEE